MSHSTQAAISQLTQDWKKPHRLTPLPAAASLFSDTTESLLRAQPAPYYHSVDGIVINDDFCIAERAVNALLPELLAGMARVCNG